MDEDLKTIKHKKGIKLSDSEIGFFYADIFSVIELYKEKRIPIMGGDIYRKTNNAYKPTYDNWYFNKSETLNDYVEESVQYAIEFLKKISTEKDIIVLTPN